MAQTLIVIAVLLAIWLVFGVLTTALRRRKLQGEHPGVGERPSESESESAHHNEQPPRKSWREGRRPWH